MSMNASDMSDLELKHLAERFLFEYAACLNDERYEEWPAFFEAADCRYEILSRENYDLGLPAPLMGCYSHGMVTDRVLMLVKKTLTFRKMYFRHTISNVRVDRTGESVVGAKANITVHQTDLEGVASLYLVGRYEDELVLRDGRLKIRKKAVILDSFGIDNMLAVPV